MAMSLSKRTSQPLSGEKDARDFDSLFQEHWDRVCRVLYRLLGDWDEAQDLAMESFLQLYHHPQEMLANPGGWLYRVSTRLGLNALRARKRRAYYEAQAGREYPAHDPGANPEQGAESAQLQAQVRAALQCMPPRSSRLLLLRYSGFSYGEIAAILGLSPASIGSLLARAEKEFEKHYKE